MTSLHKLQSFRPVKGSWEWLKDQDIFLKHFLYSLYLSFGVRTIWMDISKILSQSEKVVQKKYEIIISAQKI